MTRVSGWAALAAAAGALACGEARNVTPVAGAGSGACASCHSAPGEAPPFRDPSGATNPALPTVGAHDAHVHAALAANLSCAECHAVPGTITEPGHLEDAPGDLRFAALARTGGVNPLWDGVGCRASYCHGNFNGGNPDNAPRWTGGASAAACGTCHGVPPSTGQHNAHVGVAVNGVAVTCVSCHGEFVRATHVNGIRDVPLPVWDRGTRSCGQACHLPLQWGE